MKRFKYRDFNAGERAIIRRLRKSPTAVVFCLSSWDIDGIRGYLGERGYEASPRFDRTAQYFTERTIDSVNSSNVLTARITRKWL